MKRQECPKCHGSGAICVLDSRETADGVRRRRTCILCGHRWTTYEVPVETLRAAYAVLARERILDGMRAEIDAATERLAARQTRRDRERARKAAAVEAYR